MSLPLPSVPLLTLPLHSLPLASSPSVYWYLTRGSGVVALILLTAALVLGVVDVRRYSTPRWPRFVIDSLHRSVSLLAVVFLFIHIITTVLDGFTSISLVNAIVPFGSSYRPFWLGLGALAFDLMIALMLTSIMRRRLGHRAWRLTHWLAYACWPIAVAHGLGTGSDVKFTWLLAINGLCALAVLGAVLLRVLPSAGGGAGSADRPSSSPRPSSARSSQPRASSTARARTAGVSR